MVNDKNKNDRNYIVYKITNKIDERIYIGCHVTDNIFDNYMGSGTNIKKAIDEFGKENFDKIVLHNFSNKEEMLDMEANLVNREFIKREDTYNIILGGGSFNTHGTVTVIDIGGNYSQVELNDPRYLSGELVGIAKDKILAFDDKNVLYKIDKNDKRLKTEELCPSVVVRDENDNKFRVSKNDPKYLSGELKSVNKDMILVKDDSGKCSLVSKNDPKYLSGELKLYWEGKKHTISSKVKIGEKNSINQKGEGNSNYGKCWIYNPELKENKSIKKEELSFWLDKGWVKGRKMKFN